MRETVAGQSQHDLDQIYRLAVQFEEELRADREPRIEDFLESSPQLAKYLLPELLKVEIRIRQSSDRQPQADQYIQRFPNQLRLIESLIVGDVSQTLCESSRRVEEEDDDEPRRDRIGRFQIRRMLGRGGFGIVYLAFDPTLNRPVAIKVPRRAQFQTIKQVDGFIEEARTAANLKHPGLVSVYDVQEEDGFPFIVQEYIEGPNLWQWFQQKQPSFEQLVRILVSITESVGYAHHRGLTHCDLKLANVLMDTAEQPHVSDFGLAVHESTQSIRKGLRFGTPPMMAPEQVRGEGHRLDGRTDIWAIGVMMYELLVRRKPFKSENEQDLFDQILTYDPRPLRQINHEVPRELERICLKCLSKRRTDRYSTSEDLRDDLTAWLEETAFAEAGSGVVSASDSPAGAVHSSGIFRPLPRVIPKGLRSFDADDSDFFLDLLPGPRDRNGTPESIRFWKSRIEETDPDETFSVGLIYGPSGCGKSSLVRAGLLPLLSSDVSPIYVEATATDTEARILRQLHKKVPGLTDGLDLVECCSQLRLSGGNTKMLLVIDQFEQWLHANKEEHTLLVQALRQADGERFQCILMVRDDFWMAVTRFLRELEVSLSEGHNLASVDLFPEHHAQKVLEAFGRAYGVLPDDPSALTDDQRSFLRQAVGGLSEEGNVVSVRLALFAEMMKHKPWTPASLQEVGGTRGVGEAFLEGTFGSRVSSPEHRFHQQAARAVLNALLPEVGTEIKGYMRSRAELLEASGYKNRHREFTDLLRILDAELRLITPTDPEGHQFADDRKGQSEFYQLSHDYLVPSLRQWLTRKQQETRRGRAELRLAERAWAWRSDPDPRQLPRFLEWLSILCFTDTKSWTASEHHVISAANTHYLRRIAVLAVLLVVAGCVVVAAQRHLRQVEDQRQADSLLHQLRTGQVEHLPGVLSRLSDYHDHLRSSLQDLVRSQQFDPSWRAALALLPEDSSNTAAGSENSPSLAELLQQAMCQPSITPDEFLLIRDALKKHSPDSKSWAEDALRNEPKLSFRAACALAGWDAESPLLREHAGVVGEELLDQPPTMSAQWSRVLNPAKESLIDWCYENFSSLEEPNQIYNCVQAIHTFGGGNLERIVELLPEAGDAQSRALTDLLQTSGTAESLRHIENLIDHYQQRPPEQDVEQDRNARAVANLTIALWLLQEDAELDQCMRNQDDPRLRSYVEIALNPRRLPASRLVASLADPSLDPDVQQGLLVALTDHIPTLHTRQREQVIDLAKQMYRGEVDSGIHSICRLILLRMDQQQWVAKTDLELQETAAPSNKWTHAVSGHTLIHIDTGDREVGVSNMEVSLRQFQQYKKSHQQEKLVMRGDGVPVVNLELHEAIRYCQWLNEQFVPDKEQWCYPPLAELKKAKNIQPLPDYLDRTGYRLLTTKEWEIACAAGAKTLRFYGHDPNLLGRYAWDISTARGILSAGGKLLPNRYGLFDVYGNAREICADVVKDRFHFFSCGSSAMSQPDGSVNALRPRRLYTSVNDADPYLGFRIARTTGKSDREVELPE